MQGMGDPILCVACVVVAQNQEDQQVGVAVDDGIDLVYRFANTLEE